MFKKINISAADLDHDSFQVISGIISRRMQERAGATCTDDQEAFQIQLAYDHTLTPDGYRISDLNDGILIQSDSKCGLLAGFGRFFRDCTLYPQHGFAPGSFRGEEHPEKPFRGIYYATHFHNFYNDAPLPEIYKYMEDTVLWGQNAIVVWYDFHHYTGADDPASVEMIHRIKGIFHYAKQLGIQTVLQTLANEMFLGSPEHLRAEWMPQGDYYRQLAGHYHIEVCPSKPGGTEAILRDHEAMLKAFADAEPDYFAFWPYDQGGCTCAACSPWGANGYLKAVNALRPLVEQYLPKAKFILSAWFIERFIHGEWEAFRKAVAAGNYKEWISYIVLFFPEKGEIPAFIKEDKSIAGIPLIDFPEISMHGAEPWGGFGTNVTPWMFTNIWERSGSFLQGGYSYSEGIYEDMNKAMMLSFYNGRLKNGMDVVKEYIKSEFSPDLIDEIAEIVELMESSIVRVRLDEPNAPEGKTNYRFILNNSWDVNYIYDRANRVDEKLDPMTKSSWRWRIIWLRAAIDYELLHNDYYISSQCETYFEELTEIYFAQNADYVVAPPTPRAVAANRGLSGL